MNRFRVWMLCILTAALLVFAAAASAEETTIVASGTCGKSDNGSLSDNLTWTLDSDGLLTISGEGEMYDAPDDTSVPWSSYKDQIKSVKIEEGVTSIVGHAFQGCEGLTQIELPSKMTSIGEAVFGGTGLTQIKLPEGITSIGAYMFEGCADLKQIDLPEGITSIGEAAFTGCSGLTQIDLPEGITNIDIWAFMGCSSLTQIALPAGVTSISDEMFLNCTSLTQIDFPAGLTSIGFCAFEGCTSLEQIELPETVTSIGGGVFNNCTGLKQIALPAGLTSISNEMFLNCTGLKQIDLPAGLTSIGKWAFEGCASLEKIELPDGVTNIGEKAFRGCTSLTQIKLPEGITTVAWNLFDGCTSLKQVELPESVTIIGPYAFQNCTSLTQINLPTGVTDIQGAAFEGCTSLTQIDLPESVTSIGGSAFSGCDSLTQINLPESMTSIGSCAFENCTSLKQIKLPAGITSLEGYLFYNCTNLKSVEIPSGVTSIGMCTFSGCSNLMQVELPEGVTSIGGSAFSGCTALTQIKLPESVTSIGGSAFYDCTGLKQIDLPESVMSIGDEAFFGCSRLTVTLPDDIQKIGTGAFRYIGRLNCKAGSVSAKQLTDSFWDGLLKYTPNLRIMGNGENLGLALVDSDNSVAEVSIPEGVNHIGNAGNYGGGLCGREKLVALKLPNTLKSIGYAAVANCTNLTTVVLPESLTTIGAYAFADYSAIDQTEHIMKMKNVVIYAKDGLTSIGGGAFPEGVTIYCWEYYYAESWARENGYNVKLLDDMLDADGNIDWSQEEKSISLQASCAMACGETKKLAYSVFPFDETNCQWSSSNPEIVSVDESGVVTALQNGEAVITLTMGELSETCTITVNTPVTSFELSRSEMYVVAKKTGRLSVVSAQPENHNDGFTWASSNETYATVDQEGTVTGKAIGDATITVTTQNGVTRECLVHVCYPVTAVKFAEETVNIHTGGTKQLTANVTMRTMSCVNQLVTFASSDLAVATVDEYGVVTAVGAGTATITAATEDGGISAACEIAVTDEHEIVTDAEIPATRKQTGLTEGAHCAVCGEVLKAQQVIAPRTDLAVAELPAETKTVLAEAFAGSDVECVVLSSACETIGSRAFADCTQLALIEIPEGVTSIADNAFEGSASVALVVKDGSYAQSYAERLGLKWRAE